MTPSNPAQDAFDIWRKALDEGTQAWLRTLGAPPAPPTGGTAPDFSQFWRPILTQGMEMWQKAASQGAVSPDFAQQWKGFLDQWIEAWSKALGQAMATEGFAQALSRYLDQALTVQAPLRKGMEQYTDQALRTLGLPSRAQVVGLAAQLVGLEERIEGLEDRLDDLKSILRPAPRAAGAPEGPPEGRQRSTGRRGPRPKET